MRNKKKAITASQSKYDEELHTRVDSKPRWAQLHADGKRCEIQEEMFIKKMGMGSMESKEVARGRGDKRGGESPERLGRMNSAKRKKDKNKNALA